MNRDLLRAMLSEVPLIAAVLALLVAELAAVRWLQ
jgi:hypothetical protein